MCEFFAFEYTIYFDSNQNHVLNMCELDILLALELDSKWLKQFPHLYLDLVQQNQNDRQINEKRDFEQIQSTQTN